MPCSLANKQIIQNITMTKVQENMVMVNQQHKLPLHGGFPPQFIALLILFCCRCQVEEINVRSDLKYVCTQPGHAIKD